MTYTPQEVRAALGYIYASKDKELLQALVKDLLGVEIPSEACCATHQSPLDFVAETFFEEYQLITTMANRSGGKTMDFAILDTLNSFYHDDCETATVGAIEEQAKRCYKYFKKMNENIPVFRSNLVASLMSETTFVNKSVVQILTGTVSGVNSPHPQKAFIDEVELMAWNILQEAFSMAQSKEGIVSQTILASTRKSAFGPMERLFSESRKRGMKTYQWCIWEVVEPFPHHDKELQKEIQEAFPEAPWDKLKKKKTGYYKWKDLLIKRAGLDDDVWAAQWLCTKAETKGLMYPQFQEKEYPEGNLRKWKYDPKYDFYLWEDYGFGENHPDVTCFVQIIDYQRPEIQIFDEIYVTHKVSSEVMKLQVERMREHGIQVDEEKITDERVRYYVPAMNGYIGDPAGLTEQAERTNAGYPVLEKADDKELYKIHNGAALIRNLLKGRHLLIDPDKCANLIGEYLTYRKKKLPSGEYTDQPEKKNDHGPDNNRYGLVRLFPSLAYGSFGVDLDDDEDKALEPITASLMDKEF